MWTLIYFDFSYVPPPTITRTSGSHVTTGERLVMTCSVSVSWAQMVRLSWNLPNPSALPPRLLLPDPVSRYVSYVPIFVISAGHLQRPKVLLGPLGLLSSVPDRTTTTCSSQTTAWSSVTSPWSATSVEKSGKYVVGNFF